MVTALIWKHADWIKKINKIVDRIRECIRFGINVIPLTLLYSTVISEVFFTKLRYSISATCLKYQISNKTYSNYCIAASKLVKYRMPLCNKPPKMVFSSKFHHLKNLPQDSTPSASAAWSQAFLRWDFHFLQAHPTGSKQTRTKQCLYQFSANLKLL